MPIMTVQYLTGDFAYIIPMGTWIPRAFLIMEKRMAVFINTKAITKDSSAIIHQYDYVEDSLVKSVNVKPEKEKDKDTVNSKESEYPGGVQQWYYYLAHNLQYPIGP